MNQLLVLITGLFWTVKVAAQPVYIHKMSPASDFLSPLPNGKYEYDAYLILLRKFENGSQKAGQHYDSLTYLTHAYAVFFEDNWWRTEVSSVSVNGFNLIKPAGRDYYEALIPDFQIHMTESLIVWSITDSTGYFPTTKTSEQDSFRFPELMYISEIPSFFPMTFGENVAWSYKISKWNSNPSIALSPPDQVNMWILSPTNNTSSLSNFQPQRFKDAASSEFQFTTYGSWMSPLSRFGVIPGKGAAVVRSYKFYPYKAATTSPGSKNNWLIVNIVETEVPLEFRE